MQNVKHGKVREIIRKLGLIWALLIIVAVFALWNPTFLSGANIILVLRQVTIVGIIACGMTLVIIGGNFDLSVGSLMSLTAAIAISQHNVGGPLMAVIMAIIAGALSGLASGFLVGKLKLNSMIVTLGMMSVLQALTLIYTSGSFIDLLDKTTWFAFIGGGMVGAIPFPVILYAIVIIIFTILLDKTTFGRKVRAVGSNNTAANFSGISSGNIVLLTYVLTGILAAVAGILISSRVLGFQNTMGQGYEFQVITAVILGGTSLNGGEGSVWKTAIGGLIVGFLFNGFIMIGLPYYFQWVAQWFIIVGVVMLDILSTKRRSVNA
ncbi:MAG: ABC transporter permease [Christensenellaceae bacterium]